MKENLSLLSMETSSCSQCDF
ncbi:hypothetical protein OIU78_022438 [Salix suchowensis]|nr:hypothetical protein OIU78_022438 [Salix suchowensis]